MVIFEQRPSRRPHSNGDDQATLFVDAVYGLEGQGTRCIREEFCCP